MTTDRIARTLSDRYRIERELGQGGMATVYLAVDLRHQRNVAIKVLHAELSAVLGPERFLKEIELTASLQHPHILPLFDSGGADGLLYYVMPFVDGESLRQLLEREQQLPVADAVRIASEVADALGYAHERGVIHRDIKPENILLHNGHALVADFGIALAVQEAGGNRITQTGLSLGTPHYMSPEQAAAEKTITARSDLYALGCVLYEMLSGNPPHTGASAQQVIMKIVTEEPVPVTRLRRSVPDNVAAATQRALEKLPADRFPTAAAFREALEDARFSSPIQSRALVANRISLLKWAAIAAGMLVVLLGAMWSFSSRTSSTRMAAWRVPVALPDSIVPIGGLAISRDGSTILFTAVYAGSSYLFRLRSATGVAELVAGTRGVGFAGLSPDGQRVAFDRGGQLVVRSVDGGGETIVMRRAPFRVPITWLDNDHILIPGPDGILSVPANGESPTRLTTWESSSTMHLTPAPLPDGKGILFIYWPSFSSAVSEAVVMAVRANGEKPVELTNGTLARFAPPNHLIVKRGDGGIVAFPIDVDRLRITGPAVPVVTGLLGGTFTNSGLFDVADDGRMIVLTGDDNKPSEIVWVDRNGTDMQVGGGWYGSFQTVAISPDGSRIAAGLYTPDAEEIHVQDVETGATSRIVDLDAQLRWPEWSRDGRTIFYTGLGAASAAVYRTAPGASVEPEVIVADDSVSRFSSPALSPDGRDLYFVQFSRTQLQRDICVMSLDGDVGSRLLIRGGIVDYPTPSPDGRWLAYTETIDQGTTALMVRSTNPSRSETWQVATSVAERPRWSRDARSLYYVASDSMRVARLAAGDNFRIESRATMFPLGALTAAFDVAPDGRFAMIRVRDARMSGLQLVMLENWQAVERR